MMWRLLAIPESMLAPQLRYVIFSLTPRERDVMVSAPVVTVELDFVVRAEDGGEEEGEEIEVDVIFPPEPEPVAIVPWLVTFPARVKKVGRRYRTHGRKIRRWDGHCYSPRHLQGQRCGRIDGRVRRMVTIARAFRADTAVSLLHRTRHQRRTEAFPRHRQSCVPILCVRYDDAPARVCESEDRRDSATSDPCSRPFSIRCGPRLFVPTTEYPKLTPYRRDLQRRYPRHKPRAQSPTHSTSAKPNRHPKTNQIRRKKKKLTKAKSTPSRTCTSQTGGVTL